MMHQPSAVIPPGYATITFRTPETVSSARLLQPRLSELGAQRMCMLFSASELTKLTASSAVL